MHAVWRELLDDEFIHAYKHGIVIECADGIQRRFYPRLFTYSADYPEKYSLSISQRTETHAHAIRVLLATIRNLGGCPCPRCLTPKDRIIDLGTQLDRQRRLKTRTNDEDRRSRIARIRDWIYVEGRALKNKFIELTLGPKSEVATSVSGSLGIESTRCMSDLSRTLSQSVFRCPTLITSTCLSLILCMRLSSALGRDSLPT